MQLLQNHRTRSTGESLLQDVGWQVVDGVSTQLGKVDRDKAKHHQIKTSPAYNGRQKAIRFEKKKRDAAGPEMIARAETQKQKTQHRSRRRVRRSDTTTVRKGSCCTRRERGRGEEVKRGEKATAVQLLRW